MGRGEWWVVSDGNRVKLLLCKSVRGSVCVRGCRYG